MFTYKTNNVARIIPILSVKYERLLASQDKESVANEVELPEKIESKNIIRDPYVLEFLGRR